MTTATGLALLDYEKSADIMMVNTGAVCEQFIGQHLLYSQPFYQSPELYCWVREKKNSPAEIDHVICAGSKTVPIEVKAGKSGTFKSLHLFIREKNRSTGLRFNSEAPSIIDAKTSIPIGDNVPFRLISLPLYMVGQARRLLINMAPG